MVPVLVVVTEVPVDGGVPVGVEEELQGGRLVVLQLRGVVLCVCLHCQDEEL